MFRRSVRWQHLAMLSIILLIACGVRCLNLTTNSLWTDEYLSLECSSGWGRSDAALAGRSVAAPDLISLQHARPLTSIWASVGSDENHPPLYFILLRIWRDLFGDSPASLRSLSVLASLLAIVFLFGVGVHLHSPTAALWACLLMAVASPQVQQAQDARAYMLVTAACLAAALALIRIDRQGPSVLRCSALFITALIAPLLHYMAFASVAAMGVYAACVMRGVSRKSALISLAASLAVFSLLWGPQMVQQHYRMIDDTVWLASNSAVFTTSILQDVMSLPARLFLDLDLMKTTGAWLSAGVFLIPLLMYRKHREMWLCWIWLVVPVAIGLTIDLTTNRRSLSMIRYTLAAAPGVYLLLGLLAATIRRTGWIPAAVVAVCCAISIPSAYEARLPDYREISRFIARSSQPSDPIVFVDSHPDTYSSEGLLSATYYLASQHHPMYVLDRRPTLAFLNQLKNVHHICVIADGAVALNAPILPGLSIDRGELLAGIAVVGTADPTADKARMARAKFSTDPQLKLALGMR